MKFIEFCQNETCLITDKSCQPTTLVLMTSGISDCVVVAIENYKGDLSATHVDTDTDLQFIADAVQKIGECAITIYQNKKSRSELYSAIILPFLEKMKIENPQYAVTVKDLVLIDEPQLAIYLEKTVSNVQAVYAELSKDQYGELTTGLRHTYIAGTPSVQERIYKRFLECNINIGKEKTLPVTVFDGTHSKPNRHLAPYATKFIERFQQLYRSQRPKEVTKHVIDLAKDTAKKSHKPLRHLGTLAPSIEELLEQNRSISTDHHHGFIMPPEESNQLERYLVQYSDLSQPGWRGETPAPGNGHMTTKACQLLFSPGGAKQDEVKKNSTASNSTCRQH